MPAVQTGRLKCGLSDGLFYCAALFSIYRSRCRRNSTICVGRILESDVWPAAKAMCVPCSANECRIQKPGLRAAFLYLIF